MTTCHLCTHAGSYRSVSHKNTDKHTFFQMLDTQTLRCNYLQDIPADILYNRIYFFRKVFNSLNVVQKSYFLYCFNRLNSQEIFTLFFFLFKNKNILFISNLAKQMGKFDQQTNIVIKIHTDKYLKNCAICIFHIYQHRRSFYFKFRRILCVERGVY